MKRILHKRRECDQSEMPAVVVPMLPTLAKTPFSNPDWLFEPKWDGFRAICFLQDGGIRFVSRNRKSLTARFVNEHGDIIFANPLSGPEELWAESVKAAVATRFKPTKLSGEPVKITGRVIFDFKNGKVAMPFRDGFS